MLQKYEKIIESSKKDLTYRTLSISPGDYIDFSSNDYLCLSKDSRVIKAGCEASIKYGAGSTGSRLLSGNKQIFEEFEKLIANDKKTESALIFNSGFQANYGVLECLLDKNSIVIFDKLNHSSMYQGVFASGAKLIRYNHLDYSQLEDILKNCEVSSSNNNIMIASETVFGMDGDRADLDILSKLSNKYGAILYLDEAHATGLYGKNGYGLSTDYQFNKDLTIIMGTFSKAIGSSGAYIASSRLIKDYLIQSCKSFIYSTAISPFCVGAAMCSWQMIKSLDSLRTNLFNTSQNLRQKLNSMGFNIKGDMTNIIPILFEKTDKMLKYKEECYKKNIIVSGIRRPTSPTPRLRIALNSGHSLDDINKLIKVLEN